MAIEREQVLRSAAGFLSRRPNASQDEIAAAVGISRATLHRYFAGRAALFEALDQLAIAQMRDALDAARWREGSATEALRRLVTACEPVSGYLTLLYTQSLDFDSPAQEGWAEIDVEVKELFLRGQRDGEFRPDLTAAWLTEAFFSLVAGAAWVIQAGRAARRDFTDMITDLLLHGVSRT
jgi:AcrR family transcriptional regulator